MIPSRLRVPLWLASIIFTMHTLSSFLAKDDGSLPCHDRPEGCPTAPLGASSFQFAATSHGPHHHRRHPPLDSEQAAPPPPWQPTESSMVNLTREDWPVPESLDPNARYLSYLSHSGFHNQRLAFINALTIAKMTGRILLVPPITLGAAVAWVPPPLLQEHIEQAENSNIRDCRDTPIQLRKERCGLFWKSRRASWSWLLGAETLTTRQALIERPYHHRSWFKTALQIEESEIFSVPDPDRRSYRILDTDEEDDMAGARYQYSAQIYVEDLLDMADYKLLEFGSLFGGTRLRLRKPENRAFYRETQALMAYRDPMLEAMSEAVAVRLGGRQKYVGLHLRLGSRSDFVANSDAFHEEAAERTDAVFRTLCSDQYGLDADKITQLLIRNRRRSPTEDDVATILPEPQNRQEAHHLSSRLACPSLLYPAGHPLVSLNTPLYIATDGANPRKDPLTALFRNSFPCLFFLQDFQTVNEINEAEIPEMSFLQRAVDPVGESLRPFLEPFLEGEVAAKARGVVGTPTSTFSAFVRSVLHEAYMPKVDTDFVQQA
ncbi:hypothetical protein RQP46_003289 [Phenoliferia psychrophenolica]